MQSLNCIKGKKLLVISVLGLLMSACSVTPSKHLTEIGASPAQARAFESHLKKVTENGQERHVYTEMNFASAEEENWFLTLAYQLWNGRISSSRFLWEGKTRYPEYEESFRYIANYING